MYVSVLGATVAHQFDLLKLVPSNWRPNTSVFTQQRVPAAPTQQTLGVDSAAVEHGEARGRSADMLGSMDSANEAHGGGSVAFGHAKNTKPFLFCFAWTTLQSQRDLALLPSFLQQARSCDGHALFTQRRGFNRSGIITVSLPTNESFWSRGSSRSFLHGNNMIGLLASWAFMLRSPAIRSFEWWINVEMDHIVFPSVVRQVLQTPADRAPTMYQLGNSFAFNRALVARIAKSWDTLGTIYQDLSKPQQVGCPSWYVNEERPNCPQDLVYPYMAGKLLKPPVPVRPCRSHPCCAYDLKRRGDGFDTEQAQLAFVRQLYGNRRNGSKGINKEPVKHPFTCDSFALIHHVYHPSVISLAHSLYAA